jgi:urocanate hydratase
MNSMDSNPPTALEFALQVERYYAGLFFAVKPGSDAEPSLGGKLLYVGQLDADARALLVAANIAGAASLAFSADAEAGKQAIRDGVVDFLVTSLDEALRILKNEIRKRSTVAVCVARELNVSNADFAGQLLERGVLPDLLPLRAAPAPEFAAFLSQGARPVVAIHPDANQVILAWSVAVAPAQWLPKLDALALDCLSSDLSSADASAHRWLHLAPRYLGRMAQDARVLYCAPKTAKEFMARVQAAVKGGEIGTQVWMSYNSEDESLLVQPSPPASSIRAQSSLTP